MSENREKTVSAFEHENMAWHYGRVNRRSMIMLISTCVMAVVLVLTFVIAYTIREKDWTERERYLIDMIVKQKAAATEVAHEEGLP